MRPRSLVFDLFGDYVRYRGGGVALADLVELLGLFGVREAAARQTLARLRREGWLDTRRDGRRSVYRLNDRSLRVLEQGRRRIFERGQQPWDGRWRLAVVDADGLERGRRAQLRRTLSWLGFAPRVAATWVCPHDRFEDLRAALDGEPVEVELLTATADSREQDVALAARCWDLEGLARAYTAFVRRWGSRLEVAGRAIPTQAFQLRVRLVHVYRLFPFSDPDLPAELLPPDWVGRRAHDLFLHGYAELADDAFAHYDSITGGPAGLELSDRSV